MKKLLTLIAFAAVLGLTAQNIPPQAINFQGVAIDKNGIPVPGMDELGNPIQNSAIRVRFSILTGSATGTASYQEEHLTTTDEFGRFNLEIGRGTAINGAFTSINWGGDKHFLQVEVDLSALGTNYTLASIQEFLSVPYALYAKTAGSTGDGDTDPTNEIQTLSLTGNLLEISMGNSVTLPPNTDSQTLSIVGGTLTISGGNSVTIPDAQTLSLNGTALSISNGNSVNLPANTDNQTLSLVGNNLSILNGNSVTLPISLDNDSTNELQTLTFTNGQLTISKGNTVNISSGGNGNGTLALSDTTVMPTLGPFQHTWSTGSGVIRHQFNVSFDTITVTNGLLFFRISSNTNYTRSGTVPVRVGVYFSFYDANGNIIKARSSNLPQDMPWFAQITDEFFCGVYNNTLYSSRFGQIFSQGDRIVIKRVFVADCVPVVTLSNVTFQSTFSVTNY